MGFSSNRSGSGGNRTPVQNVAFRVTGYNVQSRGGANIAQDTFTAELLADALGHPAGTELTFRQAKDNKSQTVHSMQYGSRPMVAPTVVGGEGVAEGCYIDRAGLVIVNWIAPKVRNPQDETSVQQLLAGHFVSCMSEETNDSGFKSQNAFMYDVPRATGIPKVDAPTLLDVLYEHLQGEAGTPGFLLRGIDLDNYEKGAFQATRFTRGSVEISKGVYRDATPEEAIARFLEGDKAKRFIHDLNDPADPIAHPLVEIIPTLRFGFGKSSLPSEGQKDQSRFFKLPVEGTNFHEHFISPGHMHIQWKEPMEEGKKGRYFTTYVIPSQKSAPMYRPQEIPTANVPNEIIDFFGARADGIGKRIDQHLFPRPSADAPQAENEEPVGPRP